MLLETMVDCGWWVDYCWGQNLFQFFLSGTRHRQRRFALLKKVPKITIKKRDQEVPFFNFIAFVDVYCMFSRVLHLYCIFSRVFHV